MSVIGPRHLFFSRTRAPRLSVITPWLSKCSRDWPPATTANTHVRPPLAGLPEFLPAATRDAPAGWSRRAAEDPPDRLRGQFRLRQEPGRRVFGDQLRVVRFGVRRDQDHFGTNPLTALAVAGQELREVEAALVPQPDVDEDDVQP